MSALLFSMNRFKRPLRLLAFILVFFFAYALRARAVERLPIDYDEDDYLRAGQEFAHLIRTSDWRGFLDTNYRAEHPPLAKIAYGVALLPLPEAPLVADVAITAPPAKVLPPDQFRAARTEAAILGSLTSALLTIINPLGGVILSIHSFTVKYTSQVMLDGLAALLSLATVVAYAQYKKRPHAGWLVASAIFLGLAADTKFLHGTVGFAILIDWLLSLRQESEGSGLGGKEIRFGARLRNSIPGFKKILLWGLLSLLVFFLANPFLWPDPVGRLQATLDAVRYTTTNSNVASAGYPMWQQLIWLSISVPWEQNDAFIFLVDTFIALLAFVGFKRLWDKERVFAIWIVFELFVLLVWRTKWPQYILIVTAPLSLAAAEGIGGIAESLRAWIRDRRTHKVDPVARYCERKDARRALPWLVPGLIALAALTVIPVLFQFAMSLTDFNGGSIRDGLTGGVWRAVWLGLTGQAAPVQFDPFGQTNYFAKEVHFAGPGLFGNLLSGGADVLVFDLFWTVLAVASQAALGIGAALLLDRRGLRGANLWRTVFILPWAVPEFVGALIWLRSFEPKIGWVTMAVPEGARFPDTLGSSGFGLAVLLVAAAWYGFPFIMLAASASLKLVPREVYDAAAMDGASGWTLFREITWPLLLPLVAPALILRAIYSFNQFYLFYVMRTDFPMTTLSNISYNFMVYGNQYAVSAAINVISIFALVIFLVWFNRWSKASSGVTYA